MWAGEGQAAPPRRRSRQEALSTCRKLSTLQKNESLRLAGGLQGLMFVYLCKFRFDHLIRHLSLSQAIHFFPRLRSGLYSRLAGHGEGNLHYAAHSWQPLEE